MVEAPSSIWDIPYFFPRVADAKTGTSSFCSVSFLAKLLLEGVLITKLISLADVWRREVESGHHRRAVG